MLRDNSKYIHQNIELVHNWANQRFRTKDRYISVNNYNCIENKLYYNRTLIAIIDKGYFWITEFDHINRGAFGSRSNHLCTRNIIDAIPRTHDYYVCKNLPIFTSNYTFKQWYKEEFIQANIGIGKKISDIKDYITDNRRRVIYNSLPMTKDNIVDYLKLHCSFRYPHIDSRLHRKYKKTIDNIKITHSYSQDRYHDWGTNKFSTTISFVVDNTIKNLIDKHFISDEEVNKLMFKRWRIEHDLTIADIKKYKPIYDDIEKRKEFEKTYIDRVEERNRQEQLKRLKKEEESILNYFKVLNEWQTNNKLDFSNQYYYRNQAKYQSIKFVSSNTPFVISSLQVRMSIDNAKKIYNIFKRYVGKTIDFSNQNIVIDGWKLVRISNTPVLYVKNDKVIIEKHSCIVIGCHIIPWFEVERFLQYHNLDW
jgi:hypothetical protein